ncbi:MAG: flagellar M-ring protein FliF [Candidatus Accumulibacter sp.]|jgi:flagellar M-ring protein FliF|nr:flagellar M-ring protein FliF [Accumulibacter sp.]
MAATEIDATSSPPPPPPPSPDAEAPTPTPTLNLADRLRAMLARLDNQQKILLMVTSAIIVALVVVSALWFHEEEYRVLFSNLSERDGGAIIAALEQQSIPYKFGPNASSILIPAERVYDVRLRLATQGLPKGGNVGFELMENQKFGISQFAEQINYQRALEGELSKTIQSIAAVQDSRVHLAIPKPTVFVREELKPSASIFLSLYPGRSLEPAQIAGIQNLVAASVSQLSPSNVTIIDQNGALLSQLKNKLLEAGLDPTQLKYVQEIEAIAIKRIEDILLPIVGKGNSRVQVAADIDFSETEQTAETHRPNTTPPDIAIRSQQTSESSTRSPSAQGVPGALTNQPPVPANAPIESPPGEAGEPPQPPLNTRKESRTNYEVDRTIRYTKQSIGVIRRLSTAVVINYRRDARGVPRALPEAEIRQIDGLVREAMGFNAERGDSVSVANASFTAATEAPEIPFWKNPESLAILRDMFKYLLIALIVAYLIFKVIRPLVKVMLKDPEEEKRKREKEEEEAKEKAREEEEAHAQAQAQAQAQEQGQGPGPGPEKQGAETSQAIETSALGGEASATGLGHAQGDSLSLPEFAAAASYDQMLVQVRNIAKNDPRAIANIIKDWTGSNANN